MGGRQSAAQYQYTIQSDNLDELTHWAPILLNAMRKMPELTDVNSDQQNNGLEADSGDRSANGGAAGRHAADARQRFVRRLRRAPDRAHVHTPMNQYFVVMEVDPISGRIRTA